MILMDNRTVEITDVGNFNTLVRGWYNVGETTMHDYELSVGCRVNIKVFSDNTVPGGVYSQITKQDKASTTVLGNIIHNRSSADYVMKSDRYRIQFKMIS
jgi:hypothetical protein